jgi:endoglycosylceramidase
VARSYAHPPRQPRALFTLIAVALLAAAACTDRGLLAPPTLEPLLVHVDEHWFRDSKQRVVILRGVDLATLDRKREPGLARAPEPEDFAWLASLGFNLIRLPITWASVEATPNVYDHGYLHDVVDPLLRLASDYGMQVVLAVHQVRWSSCIPGGSGAPRWTCAGESTPAPTEQPGWGRPGALAEMRAIRAACRFFGDARAPDHRKLREHYVDLWRNLARYYEQDKRVFGFDLVNEPTPSDCFPPQTFTPDVLTPLYAELRQAIRAEGAPQALVYQPAVRRGSPLLGAPEAFGPGAVFAPHLFTQIFGRPAEGPAGRAALAAQYRHAQRLAGALGGPLLIGEIGADAPADGTFRPATPEFLAASFDELDRRLIGGAVWAFVPHGDDPGAPGGLGINGDDVAVLARPYARRIAGLPLDMGFDAKSRTFTFSFRDDPTTRPHDPSEIFLPAKLAYPTGFTVEVTAGDRWKFDEHNERLLLYRGDATQHSIRITPSATRVDPGVVGQSAR